VATAGGEAWTMALYLDGDNDLRVPLRRALERLEALPAIPGLAIVAQIDGERSGDSWRYIVQPGGAYVDGVSRWWLGEVNMGDPQTLADFVAWAHARYPSQRMYLALADHGRGTEGLAWDDTSNRDHLSNADLRQALQTATGGGQWKIDVLHYDTCLMGLLENAYEVRPFAGYLVSSENLAWSVFAYADYAPALVAAGATPAEVARGVAESYFGLPSLSEAPRTIAAVSLGEIEGVRAATDALAQALTAHLSSIRPELATVLSATQAFDSQQYNRITADDEYRDLVNLAQRLQLKFSGNTAINEAAQQVIDAVQRAVVVERHASGFYGSTRWDLDNAHGIAIYFPPPGGSHDYAPYIGHQIFSFTGESQWDDFLKAYYGEPGLPITPPPGIPPMQFPAPYVLLPLVAK
jgi:hypothetical protein